MSRKDSRLMWYVRRLQSMSPQEIMFRVHELLKRKADRIIGDRHIPLGVDYGQLPKIPQLRENLENWKVPDILLKEWQGNVRQMKSGNHFLLGQAWPETDMPADNLWHYDPVSKQEWPANTFCFDINYRHTSDFGDIKLVWELNRLQYLQTCSALALKTHDEGIARECLHHIESWIDHNPPFKGVNWCSGIEHALRIVSMIVVTTFVGEFATEGQRSKIWQTLQTHGRWLARYISAYSSANNHRTAEGLGLFVLGELCPQLKEAPQWKKTGWELLLETARLQILDDGVGAEQTVSYTAVVLEMLLLGYDIALKTGHPVETEYKDKIIRGGTYLRWFTDSEGNLPHIGDNDNARVIGTYSLDETYILSVMGAIAAMTNETDLVPPSLKPHLRNALFGHPPSPTELPDGIKLFDKGGYTVGRHTVKDKKILLAADHGYLGYLSIAAHGHADALALWFHIDGQPVLIDSGTYLYHSGGDWRTYFRSTIAHNTMEVEGESSSIISGNFNWSQKANATGKITDQTDDHWCLEMQHDGYLSRFGVRHHRKIDTNMMEGKIRIEDFLEGESARNVKISYLFHPDLDLIHTEDGAVIVKKGDVTLLTVNGDATLNAHIYPVTDEGNCGWFSETFNVKTPSPRLVFEGRLEPEQRFTTYFSL